MIKGRHGIREFDIAESRQLILELGTMDPVVLQCINVLQSTALSQDIELEIDGVSSSKDFLSFVNTHYHQACLHAIRAAYMYGFIPWRIRRLRDGNKIPEVLPPGTFTWLVKSNTSETKNRGYTGTLLHYEVKPKGIKLDEHEIYITPVFEPSQDISTHSNIYACVSSPLSHIVPEYKHMREAIMRRAHADKWNTSARILTEYHPPRQATDNPQQTLLQSAEIGMGPMFNFWQNRDSQIEDQFGKPSNHPPQVYNMPKDVKTTVLPQLHPCEVCGYLFVVLLMFVVLLLD